MTLLTKCILHPKENSDGIRISIMSRHTLSDGKTPDRRITTFSYDIHIPLLAPSTKLIGDYYNHNLSWEEYEHRFFLQIKPLESKLYKFAKLALTNNITLLCIEDTPDRCHRRLLAEICKRLVPKLTIVCK